jgi:RND family efflux transporter MFP subunit
MALFAGSGWLLAAVWSLAGTAKADAQTTSADRAGAEIAADRSVALPATVSVAPLQKLIPNEEVRSFTGIVTARRETKVGAKMLGRVDRILVDLGDNVAEGDLLIELDSRELSAEGKILQNQLAAAEAHLAELEAGPRDQEIRAAEARVAEVTASLKLAQATATRNEKMLNQSAISRQEYDDSQFEVQARNAQLDSAVQQLQLLREGTRQEQIAEQLARVESIKAQIERNAIAQGETRILAPFAGQIQARRIDEGAIVAPGQALLEIVESGAREIHVGVPADAFRVRNEIAASIRVGDMRFPIHSSRVAPTLDSRTRSYEVVFPVDDVNANLPIGSSITVEVSSSDEQKALSTDHGVWVPKTSLTASARGLWVVYVAVPDTAHPGNETDSDKATGSHRLERRQVEMLKSRGEWSEVRGPLDGYDLIVIDGVHFLTDGQSVNIRQ